ncbi:NB-ARC domain disease resistance protein [Trifolium medium]|uniref:NB-ARC domain disease resistance protein n=1 Tax=Trifolium medium TaxID=97028 RepID=A0A392QRR6_9FABA|nr:NB-ARC domain disease resistance protein [Trifolium medium]
MAETVVLFVLQKLCKLVAQESYKLVVAKVNLLKGLHEGFQDIQLELESIQAFLKDADSRAADDGRSNEGVKTSTILEAQS